MGTVGAIILAAGRSGRMGRCKALLEIEGKPAVRRICENLYGAGIQNVVIVTGYHAVEIEDARQEERCVFNADHATGGMISSVKTGLRAAGACDAILIALVDHPMVASRTVEGLIAAAILHPNKILRPRYDGRMGHPVMVPGGMVESILELPQEATLKTWMMERAGDVMIVDVDDPGIVIDLDTPADYEKIVKGSTKSETNSKFKEENSKRERRVLNFGFVSDFVFRISDLEIER